MRKTNIIYNNLISVIILLFVNKVNRTTEAQPFSLFYPSYVLYQIIGGKSVKNIQIDLQTTETNEKAKHDVVSVRVTYV